MLSILCPHCGTKQTADESYRGANLSCLACGQEMALALQPPGSQVEAVQSELAINTRPSSKPAVRRRRRIQQAIRWSLHLVITAVTIYCGYYVMNRQAAEPPPRSVAIDSQAAVARQPVEQQPPTRTAPAEVDRARIDRGPAAPVVAHLAVKGSPGEASPFRNWPEQVELPPLEDTSIVTLAKWHDGVDYTLVSIDPALQQRGKQVVWWNDKAGRMQPVAGLAVAEDVEEEVLKFRWLNQVSSEAEIAMRSALLRFKHKVHEHRVRLRRPQLAAPLAIDLKKEVQHIPCRCSSAPAAESIQFELLTATTVHPSIIASAEQRRLRLRQESQLHYTTHRGVTTKLRCKRHGSAIAVEVETHFQLPSGERRPLTLASGEAKLKELSAARQQLEAAKRAIEGLRQQRKQQQAAAKKLAEKRSKSALDTNQLAALSRSLAGLQQQIAYAEELISQESAINQDFHALQAIAELARELQGKLLHYRYFMVLDGQEIDLVRSDLSPQAASIARAKK